MNKAKLIALCAKARGWVYRSDRPDWEPDWVNPHTGRSMYVEHQHNPIDDANQADDLLEYVARKLNCSWSLIYHAHLGQYDCWLHCADCGTDTTAETQNLAKILCALRASGKVVDAEINDAMEGE